MIQLEEENFDPKLPIEQNDIDEDIEEDEFSSEEDIDSEEDSDMEL